MVKHNITTVKINKPNYHIIFMDILEKKHPEKASVCESLLSKRELNVIDILQINKIIFGSNKTNEAFNQKHKSYTTADILQILDYQKKYRLNNIQVANHFKISRNTVSKWKKVYLI